MDPREQTTGQQWSRSPCTSTAEGRSASALTELDLVEAVIATDRQAADD
jgi:hypothetical protein